MTCRSILEDIVGERTTSSTSGATKHGDMHADAIAVNSRYSPSYSSLDSYSGRCRCSKSTFRLLRYSGSNGTAGSVKLGSIVRVRFIVDCSDPVQYECVCTVWPDQLGVLEDNHFAVDDTVRMSRTERGPTEWLQWLQCRIEVRCMAL